jgi:hypothetical protein
MSTPIPQQPKTVSRTAIFKKWKRWRNRLRHEFINLLVQQRHFHELRAITEPYIGTDTAWELARSMAQGYAAFAFTAIRRMAESPKANTPKSKEIVSIPTLLKDVQANGHLITRTHQRRRYKKAMRHLPECIYVDAADSVHDAVCNGDDVLQADSVERDLKLILRTVKRIIKLTDKAYAHIERDRRRIPKNFGFDKADEAIKTLFGILRKYSLCIFGEGIVLPQIEDFSVAQQLRKVWPNDAPLPKLPSVNEELEI